MHTAPTDPPNRLDWQSLVSTDVVHDWGDPRQEPPTELGDDPLARWGRVREMVQWAAARPLQVDRLRRIEARLRTDGRMVSRYGELDPLTVIALLWFQRDHGLSLTGYPDAHTLDALGKAVPDLHRAASRRLRPPGVIVPSHTPSLQRFLHYRAAILAMGGLLDEEHRAVNVLVLTHAELVVGRHGLAVRATPTHQRSFVTVSLWMEREGGAEDGEVVGVTARERPGLVQPVVISEGRRTPTLEIGQFLCDLDGSASAVLHSRALLPRFPTDPQTIPLAPPNLPLADFDVPPEARDLVDPERMTWDRFLAELDASHRERASRRRWHGLRLTVLDTSQLDALT